MLTGTAVVIAALAAFYVATNALAMTGVRRLSRFSSRRADAPDPFVSILVAAKDEEENIGPCLESLLSQDYPTNKREVVLVNDRSTDRTREIAEGFLSNHPNLKLVNIIEDPIDVTGKQAALRRGVKECRGEFVLNTDADCVAPPGWVRAMVAGFGDDIGLLIGIPLTHARGRRESLLTRIQSLDLAALLHMAVGAAGWNRPASCIGNNFAYRRAAFDEVGGYEAMEPALTEDAQLVRMIHRKSRWKVSGTHDPNSVVITQPADNWRAFYRQRARWILGGWETGSSSIRFLQAIMVYYWFLLASPLVIAFAPCLREATFAAMASKLIADFALVWQSASRLGRRDILRPFLAFAVYYVLYGGLIGLTTIFSRKVVWKGQVYRRRQR